MVVIDNLANFLSISPNQTKFFPLCFPGPQLDFSATSVSVSAVSKVSNFHDSNIENITHCQFIKNISVQFLLS
jgi:hypothetical protein